MCACGCSKAGFEGATKLPPIWEGEKIQNYQLPYPKTDNLANLTVTKPINTGIFPPNFATAGVPKTNLVVTKSSNTGIVPPKMTLPPVEQQRPQNPAPNQRGTGSGITTIGFDPSKGGVIMTTTKPVVEVKPEQVTPKTIAKEEEPETSYTWLWVMGAVAVVGAIVYFLKK